MSNKKIKLSRAISRGDKKIKEIELRELTVRDIEKAGEYENGVTRQIVQISCITGLSEDEVRSMATKDYLEVGDYLNSNFT